MLNSLDRMIRSSAERLASQTTTSDALDSMIQDSNRRLNEKAMASAMERANTNRDRYAAKTDIMPRVVNPDFNEPLSSEDMGDPNLMKKEVGRGATWGGLDILGKIEGAFNAMIDSMQMDSEGGDPVSLRDYYGQMGNDIGANFAQQARSAVSPFVDRPHTSTGQMVEGGMDMLAPVAGGMAMPGTMPLLFGITGAGASYNSALERGRTPQQAANEAGVSGVASGLIGALPIPHAGASPIERIASSGLGMVGMGSLLRGSDELIQGTVGGNPEAMHNLGEAMIPRFSDLAVGALFGIHGEAGRMRDLYNHPMIDVPPEVMDASARAAMDPLGSDVHDPSRPLILRVVDGQTVIEPIHSTPGIPPFSYRPHVPTPKPGPEGVYEQRPNEVSPENPPFFRTPQAQTRPTIESVQGAMERGQRRPYAPSLENPNTIPSSPEWGTVPTNRQFFENRGEVIPNGKEVRREEEGQVAPSEPEAVAPQTPPEPKAGGVVEPQAPEVSRPAKEPVQAPPPSEDTTIEFHKDPVVNELAKRLHRGDRFQTIIEARKAVAELQGKERIEPGTPEAKQADEIVEQSIVAASRRIAEEGRRDGAGDAATFDRLLDLYKRQPRLGTRSSTSVENQAYSTPAPLAYVASRLAGIGPGVSVYEPSAGNGLLLLDADPKTTHANELDPDRANSLANAGFMATGNDATKYDADGRQFQAIVANPPFGKLLIGDERIPMTWDTQYGRTNQIDHAIVFNALKSLRDDGRAVLIVGGVKDRATPEERASLYNTDAKRMFYYHLYQNYNVVDHATVAGDMYDRQGAKFPVDVITIEGRGKSALRLPAAEPPRVLKDWEGVKELLNGVADQQPVKAGVRTAPVESTGGGGGGGGRGPRGTDVVEPVSGTAGPKGPVVDRPSGGEGSEKAPVRKPDSLEPTPRPVGSGGDAGVAGGGEIRNDDVRRPQQPETVSSKDEPIAPKSPPTHDAGGVAERDDAPRTDVIQQEGNTFQVPYEPVAKGVKSVTTQVPRNQRDAVRKSLEAVQEKHGELTKFVARELGFNEKDMAGKFSAEQVDALALAMASHKDGSGFVIGDQTGIGKGRFVAAMMHYAERKGLIPVFVTVDPKLYADILRDTKDIGLPDYKILPTNNDMTITLDDGRVVAGKPGQHHRVREAAGSHLEGKGLLTGGEKYNAIATTYSQLDSRGKEPNPRRDLMREIAPRAMFILDESHNAGGSETGKGWKVKGQPEKRSEYMRTLIDNAAHTVFSSATWAKRPSVMDLYRNTDMRLAVDNVKNLGDAIRKGGVAMQQVVSEALTQVGQYIRRERDFSNVEFRPETVAGDLKYADDAANVFTLINRFDKAKKAALKNMAAELAEAGQAAGKDSATGSAGVRSTNFTSIMHNVVAQMHLAAKANAVADMAIKAIQNGEKPVIVVANTMEGMIEDVMSQSRKSVGDEANASFNHTLHKYLERSRTAYIKQPGSKKLEAHYLTDEELGPAGVYLYNEAKSAIDKMDDSNMPASPIDWIRHRLSSEFVKGKDGKARNVVVGELTGRKVGIQYGDKPVYFSRPASEKTKGGQVKIVSGFQRGDVDAMILNSSGATGISLHSDVRAADQRQRHMLIAQPDPNIDTFMQALGRVNRTGQKVPPIYSLVSSDLPSENRLGSVLAKKMASLNANVTSSRKGSVDFKAPDLMNEVGDLVAQRYLQENPEISEAIEVDPRSDSGLDEFAADPGKLMAALTGRYAMMPMKQQEAFWNELGGLYESMLEELNATGINPLESKVRDLRARTLDVRELTQEKGGAKKSWFTSPSVLERVEARTDTPPLTLTQIAKMTAQAHGVPEHENPTEVFNAAEKAHDKVLRAAKDEGRAYQKKYIDELVSDEAKAKHRVMFTKNNERFIQVSNEVIPGRGVTVNLGGDAPVEALVVSVKRNGHTKNPLALSGWTATLATADPDTPTMKLSFTSFASHGENAVEGMYPRNRDALIERIEKASQQHTSERYIATGNLLSAFEAIGGEGRMVFFTRADGKQESGILLPKDFDPQSFAHTRERIFSGEPTISTFLTKSRDGRVNTLDGEMSVFRVGDEVTFSANKSKQSGGRYYLNKKAIDAAGRDFVSAGGRMVLDVPREKAGEVIRAFVDSGVKFKLLRNEATRPEDVSLFDSLHPEFTNEAKAPKPPTGRASGGDASAGGSYVVSPTGLSSHPYGAVPMIDFVKNLGERASEVKEGLGNWFSREVRGYDLPAFERAARSAPSGRGSQIRNASVAAVQHASATFAARAISRAMLGEVVGVERMKDLKFLTKLGAVLTQDNLDTLRRERAQGVREGDWKDVRTLIGPNEFFKTTGEYYAALRDPQVQDAIQKWKDIVNPWMDEQYKEQLELDPQAVLESRGEETGARINLRALDPNEIATGSKTVVAGTKNPPLLSKFLKKKSPFAMRATGEAEAYDINAAGILENTVHRQWDNATRMRMYKALVTAGLAKYGKPGSDVKIDGKDTFAIDTKRMVIVKNGDARSTSQLLYIRGDLMHDVEGALGKRGDLAPIRHSAIRTVANALTWAQMKGLIDPVAHTVNIVRAISRSPGGQNVVEDLARAMPGVNFADAVGREVHSIFKVIGTPTQNTLNSLRFLAENGMLRGEHAGRASVVDVIDRAGRLVMNNLFDTLVQRGLYKDSMTERRRFVNQIGQYNPRLRGAFDNVMKKYGIAPFVVAGKTFNRLGDRAVGAMFGLDTGGAEAKSGSASAQLRARQVLAGVLAPVGIAVLLNALRGLPAFGRPGVPVGAVDTGKDDDKGNPVYVDLFEFNGARRGLREWGIDAAVEKGVRGDLSPGQTIDAMVDDVLNSRTRPFAGPAIDVGTVATTGHGFGWGAAMRKIAEPTGPSDAHVVSNLKAAAEVVNPHIERSLQAQDEGENPIVGNVKGLSGFAGIKSSKPVNPRAVEGARLNEYMDELFSKVRREGKTPADRMRRVLMDMNEKGVVGNDRRRVITEAKRRLGR